jgi:hypothetical protein
LIFSRIPNPTDIYRVFKLDVCILLCKEENGSGYCGLPLEPFIGRSLVVGWNKQDLRKVHREFDAIRERVYVDVIGDNAE